MTDTHTGIVTVTPVITAGAYVANDAVGGLLTFEKAIRVGNVDRTGVLLSVAVKDLAKQDAPLELVLFNRSFTPTADNAPFDPSDADLANCLGVIPILSTDYVDFVDNSIATLENIGLGVASKVAASKGNLYGQLVTRGTPTYTSTSDLSVTLTVLQD